MCTDFYINLYYNIWQTMIVPPTAEKQFFKKLTSLGTFRLKGSIRKYLLK